MTSTVSKYLAGLPGKRKPSSTSSDSCASPGADSVKEKQDKKKLRQDSQDSEKDVMISTDAVGEVKCLQGALEDIRQTLNNLATKDDIRQLREDMNKITVRLESRIDKLESDVFEIKNERDVLKSEMNKLKEENKGLRGHIEQCRKEDIALKNEMNDQEQHGRQFNVRVYGVRENQGHADTVEDCVKHCAEIFTNRVGVQVSPGDIEIAHRVGKPGGAKPRPIIARFFSRRLRGRVLADRQKLKQSGVSVGEDLTQRNYQLLKRATEHSATMVF